jgi:hypothetical protein
METREDRDPPTKSVTGPRPSIPDRVSSLTLKKDLQRLGQKSDFPGLVRARSMN